MFGQKRVHVLLIAILLLLISLLLMLRSKEYFALQYRPVASNQVIPQQNSTDNVWDRHPIQDTVETEYDVQSPNVYYNELRNSTFLEALQKTFAPYAININGAEWEPSKLVNRKHIPPQPVIEAYQKIVPWILDKIQQSPDFGLPGDDPAPFQIIHDHWNTWSKSILTADRVKYDLEVLIYREAKYHAKHVEFEIVMEKDNIIGVSDIKILGIVLEDKFGLFPVISSDKIELENQNLPFDPNPLATYPPICNESIIDAEVAKREKQKIIMDKIQKLYDQEQSPMISPSPPATSQPSVL